MCTDRTRRTDTYSKPVTLENESERFAFVFMAVRSAAAGLRAGKPTDVGPHAGDQPFWARVLFDLDVSPKCIPIKKLTAGRLAGAVVQATTDAGMRERAAEIGARIGAEDGVARAIEFIDNSLIR